MADRYFHVDVSFMHKTTCAKLRQELGPIAPLVFLALCAQAKISNPPGHFIYENEALGWERLGFTEWQPDFTLESFFAVTGKLKQSSRTRRGLVTDVTLTRYGRWQKDGKRQIERERKSRYRAQNARDKDGTDGGTPDGTEGGRRTRPRTTPQPPTGQTETHPHDCPVCGTRQPSKTALTAHLELDHSSTNGDHPVDGEVAYLEDLGRTQLAEETDH